jgi:hypothetical protein
LSRGCGRVWGGGGAVGAGLPRGPSCVRARAGDEPGSRLAGGHPWKGLGLDAGEERRRLRRAGRSRAPQFDGAHAGSSPSHGKWVRQPVVRCRASLRPLGSMERCGQHQAGSSRSTTTPPGWGSRRSSSSCLGCAGPSPRLLEAADAAIAHAVEDEGENLAGRGDAGDLGAAPLRDASVGGTDGAPTVVAGHGFGGGPPHQR